MEVVAVSGLRVVATVTTSPHATGSYIVQHRAGVPFKDYAVAFQCGHLLRLLAQPPSQRYQFAASRDAMRWGAKLVRDFLKESRKPPLPDKAMDTFTEQLVSGLLTQLRSIPTGMRVDQWLAVNHPTLADQQVDSLAAQQSEALACLSPQVRTMVPDEIVSPSILLNSAYALFCDHLLGTTVYAAPYAATGLQAFAETLLRIYEETPDAPSSDRDLVDRWAAEIGLAGKYMWVELPSAGPPAP